MSSCLLGYLMFYISDQGILFNITPKWLYSGIALPTKKESGLSKGTRIWDLGIFCFLIKSKILKLYKNQYGNQYGNQT